MACAACSRPAARAATPANTPATRATRPPGADAVGPEVVLTLKDGFVVPQADLAYLLDLDKRGVQFVADGTVSPESESLLTPADHAFVRTHAPLIKYVLTQAYTGP